MLQWFIGWLQMQRGQVICIALGMLLIGWVACYMIAWTRAKRAAEAAFWAAMEEEYDDLVEWDTEDLESLREAVEIAMGKKGRE